MAHTIQLTPAATRALEKLPAAVRRAAGDAIRRLAETPRPPGCKALQGKLKGLYRVAFGPKKDYRLVYKVEDKRLLVVIVNIADRKDAYG